MRSDQPERVVPLTKGPDKLPNPTRRRAATFMLWCGIGLIILQLWNIRARLVTARELEVAPVSYSDFRTDRDEYAPGDLIHFTHDRTAKSTESTLPILLLIVDSFENQETGELFAGQITTRIVKKIGTAALVTTRRIPNDCTPGTYVFIGVVSSQTSRISRAASFTSNRFTVRPRQP